MLKNSFRPKKGQLASLIALLALVVAFMGFLMKCSHSMHRPANPFASDFVAAGGDTLNVAIEMNPSVYMATGDTVTGRDYDILQSISRAHGVPLKYHPFVPLAKALGSLDDGVVDMVVTTRPANASLKEKYLLTTPVYVDREVLVQRKDSTAELLRSQMDLGGETVWIPSQASLRSRLENLSEEIGDTIFINQSEYSAEALLILVSTGKIRYAVINEDIAMEMLPKFSNIDISVPISFSQFRSWVLRKDNTELCDSLNSWLSNILEKAP